MTELEAQSLPNGKPVPSAMREYYQIAGNHWLNSNHNQLRLPHQFEAAGDYTVFMDENQLVAQWAIHSPDDEDDPLVYQGVSVDGDMDWHAESYTFSRFIIAMWKWILTGEPPSPQRS